MSKIVVYIYLSVAVIFMLTINGCTKINYTSDPYSLLEFSEDTLLFDSVFTTIGSVSYYLTVKNPHDQALLIDKIQLEDGLGSDY